MLGPETFSFSLPQFSEHASRHFRNDLVVVYGFTIYPETFAELMTLLPCDVSALVDAIFRAEGLDPETSDRHLWRQIRDAAILRSSEEA